MELTFWSISQVLHNLSSWPTGTEFSWNRNTKIRKTDMNEESKGTAYYQFLRKEEI